MCDPEEERVTVMKSMRVGYTKIVDLAIGYYMDADPCSMLVVQPTIDDAEGFSKDEIAPMLRDVPCLQGKVQRDDDTLLKSLSRRQPDPGWCKLAYRLSPSDGAHRYL